MDLILLYYFDMLANCKSFSVAAEKVYLSQSSFSKRIKGLEDKLGVELFVRTSRCVELTEKGRALLPYAENILQEWENLRTDIENLRNEDLLLRIAAISFLSYYGITEHIMSYIKKNQEVNVSLRENGSVIGLDLLQKEQLEAVLMFVEEMSDSNPYDVYPLVQDELVGVMKQGHELAEQSRLTLSKLCTQELILISEHDEPFFQNIIKREAAARGIILNIRRYRVWIGAIETIIKQSDSIAVLPKRVAERMKQENIVYKEIEDMPKFWFSIVTRANDNNRVLHDFIKYLAITI